VVRVYEKIQKIYYPCVLFVKYINDFIHDFSTFNGCAGKKIITCGVGGCLWSRGESRALLDDPLRDSAGCC